MSDIKKDAQESLEIVKSACSSDVEKRRNSLHLIEQEMVKHPQLDIPVKHLFSGGMYAREITIPKGTLLTGRIHKFDHFDIMLSGDITVSTDSEDVKRLTGLNIMTGNAGKKRAGYAHEDTHWITFHLAKEQAPEKMFNALTCATFEELDDFHIRLEAAIAEKHRTEQILTEIAESICGNKEFVL